MPRHGRRSRTRPTARQAGRLPGRTAAIPDGCLVGGRSCGPVRWFCGPVVLRSGGRVAGWPGGSALPRACASACLRFRVAAFPRACVPAFLRSRVAACPRSCASALPRSRVAALLRSRVAAFPRGRVPALLRFCASAWRRARVPALLRPRAPAWPRFRVPVLPRARVPGSGPSEPIAYMSRFSSGRTAGPWRMRPSGAKREPWQGHSQACSARLKATRQPRWVQWAETAWS